MTKKKKANKEATVEGSKHPDAEKRKGRKDSSSSSDSESEDKSKSSSSSDSSKKVRNDRRKLPKGAAINSSSDSDKGKVSAKELASILA